MFCQLEMLRNCLPQNVRRILRELPASLDETYERMLRELMKVNPDQVYRLLQCITVSIRPLRVEELAEILALDFDLDEGGIPVLNEGWRTDDKEQSVLSICSSLIVVVDSVSYDPLPMRTVRVVQFAHFSVKEFLTSDRLANIKADISCFHIRLEPAHTFITQACLAILLQSDRDDRVISTSPLSKYAAQNWVGHAQFENVSLRVEDGMRRLFNPAKPYFAAWVNLCDLDNKWSSFLQNDHHAYRRRIRPRFIFSGEDNTPLCLYYAAFCGFCGLTKHFITMYPQHVNVSVGHNYSPLVAALHNRHLQVAELLHQHGAVLPIGYMGRTLLHAASTDGLADVAQWLLSIGLDVNAREDNHKTPLHLAAAKGRLEIVRILLSHGAHVNAAATNNNSPLHEASSAGHVDVVRLLIEHEADVHAQGQCQSMPLHLAASENNAETAQLLIKHGADIHTRDERQSTPLHIASSEWHTETAQVLIEHGADVHARNESQSTPLHLASSKDAERSWGFPGYVGESLAWDDDQAMPFKSPRALNATVQLLIKHGADVNARDKDQSTPLHLASSNRGTQIAQQLLEHGADVHAHDEIYRYTPLHLASRRNDAEMTRLLIKHGADVHARSKNQATPLYGAFYPRTAHILIKHGADVHARNQDQSTPLHCAPTAETARVLIKHGADVHARNQDQSTPLHIASVGVETRKVRVLIEHGANVNAYDKNHQTPLHLISSYFHPDVDSLRLLLENGADVDVKDDQGLTPFQIASSKAEEKNNLLSSFHREITQLLLDHRTSIVSNAM